MYWSTSIWSLWEMKKWRSAKFIKYARKRQPRKSKKILPWRKVFWLSGILKVFFLVRWFLFQSIKSNNIYQDILLLKPPNHCNEFQKQRPEVFFKQRCSEKMEQIYRRTLIRSAISIKLLCISKLLSTAILSDHIFLTVCPEI